MKNEKEYNFDLQRKKLREKLAKKYLFAETVLDAIGGIPRELFAGESNFERAYDDIALPIDNLQTISQPYTVAYMTHHLDVSRGSKVLEIGTGSGFQTAILYALGAEVFTIERIENLHFKSKELFERLSYKIHTFLGDGTLGLPELAPFDRIIVTAASPEVPSSLLSQLASGGKMILPVGDRSSQEMLLIEKNIKNNIIETTQLDRFRFVPLIGKEGW